MAAFRELVQRVKSFPFEIDLQDDEVVHLVDRVESHCVPKVLIGDWLVSEDSDYFHLNVVSKIKIIFSEPNKVLI